MRPHTVAAWRRSVHWYLLIAVLIVTALMGGSARPDNTGLLLLRPLVVVLLGAMLLIRGQGDAGVARVPLLMLAIFAATIALQLVPLPPGLWLALPGHARFAASVPLAGPHAGWRPISLDPDLTLNALVSLLPALAMIIGYGRLSPDQRSRLLPWAVGIAAASALLGLVQILGGGDSPAYLYRYTTPGLPVGLLANRNHQAVFLALALPALATWAMARRGDALFQLRLALAAGGAILFVPVIILTGSRSGLLMAVLAMLATLWVLRVRFARGPRGGPRLNSGRIAIVVGLVVLALVGYMVSTNQAMSLSRLIDANELTAEKRILATPTMLTMLRDFFPVGIGHGAFDPVFRAYETDRLLSPTYFNRAHNDLLETALSGGLLGIAALAMIATWFARRVILVQRRGERTIHVTYARLAIVVMLGFTLASLTDYPLRTPLLSVVFTLACLWLEDGAREQPGIAAT